MKPYRILNQIDNIVEVAQVYLSLLESKVTKNTVKEEIEAHPNYPTILSLLDTFKYFGINCTCIRSSIESISSFPLPLIAPIYYQGKSVYTVIRKIDGDLLHFLNPDSLEFNDISREEFSTMWLTKTMLIGEVNELFFEENFEEKQKVENKQYFIKLFGLISLPFLIFLYCISSLLLFSDTVIINALYIITAFLGLIITVLIAWSILDRDNFLVRRLCKTSSTFNCQITLDSTNSKVFGISLTSISFVYFLSIIFLILFNTNLLSVIALSSYCAILIIILSIYHQWRILKSWCKLCIYIQIVLICQVIIAFTVDLNISLNSTNFLNEYILPIFTSILFSTLLYNISISSIELITSLKVKIRSLAPLKNNSLIFKSLLMQGQSIETSLSTINLGVHFGNENSSIKILKVCNPFCQPCSESHSPLKDILRINSNVHIQIIFYTNPSNELASEVIQHFLAISEIFGKKKLWEALGVWHGSHPKNYSKFKTLYPVDSIILQNMKIQIKEMNKWCAVNSIKQTPTYFVNDYELPEEYSIDDLKFLLAENLNFN